MKEYSFEEILGKELLVILESPVLHKVYDRFLDDTDSDLDYKYNIVKNLINGEPYYLNDIIYAISGYIENLEWKEIIKEGKWFIIDSEVDE